MKKYLLYIYFIDSLILGTFIYFAEDLSINLPDVIKFYVNDFLIIPIILIPCLWFLRWSKNDANYTIPLWLIIVLCSGYAIYFEYYLPKYYSRYTSDIIDVILYFASGIVFYFLQHYVKKPAKNTISYHQ